MRIATGFRALKRVVFFGLCWLPLHFLSAQQIPITTYRPGSNVGGQFTGTREAFINSPVFLNSWQHPSGLMYFHNGYGIYSFDGRHWDIHQFPNPDQVTAATMNEVGQIWFGGNGTMGTLTPTRSGHLAYRSLLDTTNNFPSETVGEILDLYSPGQDSIYILTQRKLYFQLGADTEWNSLQTSTSFSKFRVMGQDSLMVQQNGFGLFYINGQRMSLYDNKSVFRNDRISFTLSHPDGGWIFSDSDRLFRYKNKEITPLYPEFVQGLKGGGITDGIWLNNGYLALGTAAQGVFFLNHEGQVVLHLSRKDGLSDNGVRGLFIDRDEQLWVTTFNNISKVDYTFPFPNVFANNSALGLVLCVSEFEDKIYLGSTSGLYQYTPETGIVPVEGVAGAIHAILPQDDQLLFGGKFGLYRLKNGELRLQASGSVQDLKVLGDNLIAAGTREHLLTYSEVGDSWQIQDTVGGLSGNFISLASHEGKLLAATNRPELFIITPNQPDAYDLVTVNRLDTADGITGSLQLFDLPQELLLGNEFGLFRLSESGDRLVPEDRFGDQFNTGEYDVFRMVKQDENYWFTSLSGLFKAEPTVNGDYHLDSTAYFSLPGGSIYALHPDSKGQVWIGGELGVSCYAPIFPRAKPKPTQALIRRVALEDSLIYFGQKNQLWFDEGENAQAVLSPDQNTLTFFFAAPAFHTPENLQFWYQLQGWDQDWILYNGTDYRINYKNLPFGRYTFRVIALDQYAQFSDQGSYTFVISPPWYWRWWAFMLYGIMLMGGLIAFVFYNTRRLRSAKSKLEMLVRMRTEELGRQKQQVEDQKSEIERQHYRIEDQLKVLEQKNRQIQNYNAELLDSLRYAKRLQDSVFASDEDIQQYFPDSFVYSLPKEIVGGDFSWVTKIGNEIVLVVADCTGHGVPGAFMSIVGYNKLQQLLKEEHLTSPEEVLNALDIAVRDTVSHSESTAMKDGMDISIVMFNPESRTLRFASAFQSLYLIREREIREVKGSRYTVGVYFGATQKHFEEHKIAVEPDDVLYLLSDGIQDQFGGPDNSKLMKKGLRKILMEVHEEPMEQQKELVAKRINQWMGSNEQVDDILIMGVKV